MSYGRLKLRWTRASNILLLTDGNSLTIGQGSSGGAATYPRQTEALLNGVGIQDILFNTGVSGQTTLDMITRAPTAVDPHLSVANRPAVLLAWELVNDIRVTPSTIPQAIANLKTYCDARRAAGWGKISVSQVMPMTAANWFGNWTAGTEVAVNAALETAWPSFADARVRLDNIPQLLDPTNSTYFASDGIHLKDAGYVYVGGAAFPVARALAIS